MNNEETQFVPYIKRTIDGRTYTVLIHFKEDAKETAKGKLKKLMKNDLRKRNL